MDDLISRQAALHSYQKEVCNKVKCYECKATDEDGTCKLERWIKELPSAERRGRWIKVAKGWGSLWKCDQCGEVTVETVMGKPRANYCPNCGADMREKKNECDTCFIAQNTNLEDDDSICRDCGVGE